MPLSLLQTAYFVRLKEHAGALGVAKLAEPCAKLAQRNRTMPRIDHLELGFAVLARRLHPRLERWLQSLRERWSVRRSARQAKLAAL